MPTSTSAVNDAVQIAIGLLGLVVLGLYFGLPKAKAWRRNPTPPPSWSSQPSDSLLLLLVVLGAVFVGALGGAAIARQLPDGTDPLSPVQMLATNVGMFVAVPIAIALTALYLRSNGNAVAAVNSPHSPPPLDAIGLGFLTFLGAAPAVIATGIPWAMLLDRLGYEREVQPMVKLLLGDCPTGVRVGLVILAVVIVPVAEELVFRAGIFRFLRSVTPRWFAVAASAVLFAALHANLAALAPLVVLGAVWAHMYEKSGSLVVTIVAHALFNLTSIGLMLTQVAPAG